MIDKYIPPDARGETEQYPIEVTRSHPTVTIKEIKGGGPGGQAVNKTSNVAELRWKYRQFGLSEQQTSLIEQALASRLKTKGVEQVDRELIIQASDQRSLEQNKELAVFRLNELVNQVLKPKKQRKPTRKRSGTMAKEKRLDEVRKTKKAGRKRVTQNDW
ncbi:MAG: peptide chain release factor-like protein [Candidatus Uhrbacteria bacterium]